jgi:hypothetical protein
MRFGSGLAPSVSLSESVNRFMFGPSEPMCETVAKRQPAADPRLAVISMTASMAGNRRIYDYYRAFAGAAH